MTAIEATETARLVRVAFSHVLSVSGDPIVDEETGFTIEWVGLDICHDRLFEAPPGWVPPIGTNPGLRVSYDPAEGFGFWADERLDCGWCVSDWMVDDGYEMRSVDRSVFEGVIQRHGHRLMKDNWLQSGAFCLLPVQGTSSQEVGGESFFHGSMRFKPGEGFTNLEGGSPARAAGGGAGWGGGGGGGGVWTVLEVNGCDVD